MADAEPQEAAASVVFKKPARKNNIRKRKADDDAAVDESSEGGPRCADTASPTASPTRMPDDPRMPAYPRVSPHRRRSVSLELMKELQRQRQRAKGVTLEPKGDAAEAAAGAEDEEGQDLSLDTTFTAQTDAGEVDPNMLKYIEEQMQKEEDAPKRASSAFDADDEELFATPAHLKKRHESASLPAAALEAEDANRWLAGIVEVSLAPEDKMAAIEATELAKRKLMAAKASARASSGPEVSMEIPANYNANFHKHRQESKHLMKSKGGGGPGGGGMGGKHSSDPSLASDGKAMAQFRAHDRNKRN